MKTKNALARTHAPLHTTALDPLSLKHHRWKWMAGATAGAAAAASTGAQAETVQIDLINNQIGHTLGNTLNADLTGDGTGDISFRLASTPIRSGLVSISSFNGYSYMFASYGIGGGNQFQVRSYSTAMNGPTPQSISRLFPITFTDAKFNGGVQSNGFVEVHIFNESTTSHKIELLRVVFDNESTAAPVASVGDDYTSIGQTANGVFTPNGPSKKDPTPPDPARYRPDLLIGFAGKKLQRDDFYTRTGKRQAVGLRLRGRKGSSANLRLQIQNDGNVEDRIRLVSRVANPQDSGGGKKVKRKAAFGYRVLTGRGKNVTAFIRRNGLKLSAGQGQRLIFTIKRLRALKSKFKRRLFTVAAISRGNNSKVDVAKILIDEPRTTKKPHTHTHAHTHPHNAHTTHTHKQ